MFAKCSQNVRIFPSHSVRLYSCNVRIVRNVRTFRLMPFYTHAHARAHTHITGVHVKKTANIANIGNILEVEVFAICPKWPQKCEHFCEHSQA